MSAPFSRWISPNERSYIASEPLAPPFALQLVIEGTGAIDPEILRAAVAKASAACPGARLIARGGRWVDGGKTPPVRILAPGAFDGFNFDQAPFTTDRLDPFNGPTCEVVYVTGDRPAIAFRAFHGVMDGRGALYWVRAVFAVLRGEAVTPVLGHVTDQGGLLARLGSTHRPDLAFDAPSPWGTTPVSDEGCFWKRLVVPGVHPGLVAKMATAIRAASDLGHARFMVPVDLRRHAPEVDAMANLSMPLFIESSRDEGWEALHGRLVAALARRDELAITSGENFLAFVPDWALRAGVHVATAWQRMQGRYLATGILSNLGRLEMTDFSAPAFTANSLYSIPVHVPLAPLALVAVECPGHVELVLSAPRGPGQVERAELLLAAIGRALGAVDAPVVAPTAYDPDATVVSLFRAQAARMPDAVAIVGKSELTYAALDRRSQAIAHALRTHGVGPGVVVALVAERREDTLVAMLGILAAGGAYLPLDPQDPDERLAFALADSGARLCLVPAAHQARIARIFEHPCLDPAALGEAPSNEPLPQPAPADLAYLIYTSGSSGRPKGVLVEHKSLANYVHWSREAYGIGPAIRFAWFTSLAFDLTVTALFPPLAAGGSIAVFGSDESLQQILDRPDVNALKLTPAHLELASHLAVPADQFRELIVGGEVLTTALATRSQALFGPSCRISNEYGPTETTVGCTHHPFDAHRDAASPTVPIGRPGANTTIYLLADGFTPVATGESGEICVSGAGVARGYQPREGLDQRAFVRLPDGPRAYRTGDMAVRRRDGVLVFQGRTDDQVKVRGHRIEPGEIEAILAEHPGVHSAVVVARPRGFAPDKVIAAYFVAREPLATEEVRTYLASRLPAYMLPTYLVPLPAIPLTANGKVDHTALPLPVLEATVPQAERGEVEMAIAGIWAAALDLKAVDIGPEADFNHLGGDSILLVEMISAVATQLVPPASAASFMRDIQPLLARPTLAAVSQAVEATRA